MFAESANLREAENSMLRGNGADGRHVIELRDVYKTYQAGAREMTVLHDIRLQVQPGEFVSVVGPSGSGKSTLLNMITGIDRPSSGQVFVAGEAVHELSENQLARWRGRNVGVIFQFFQLLPTLTILENVVLPMDFCSTYKRRERRERAMELLEMVGIADQAHKLPTALSGGQQQRAAIARALANDPPLLVADEPTGNLDTATADQVFALFERLVDKGKTVMLVTHDRHLSARTGRVLHLLDGRLQRDNVNGARRRTCGPKRGNVLPTPYSSLPTPSVSTPSSAKCSLNGS
jgi:putative ABC transport system ATP-binding protein